MSGHTALYLIKGALRRITAYQSGEAIAPPDQQDCLDTLNDLFDSWSNEKSRIYGSVENILTYTAGQSLYTIGNPLCTDLGQAPFAGNLTASSPTISNVNPIPANLLIGASLTDFLAGIPAGTTVTGFNAGAHTVTMSQNALATASTALNQFTYSVPGNFAIPRPNRVTHGFTRMNQLDFTIDVTMSQSRFTEILYKAQPGPWPTVAWYNNLMPYGQITFYQTPANNGELHLFTDTILGNLTINQVFVLPMGYARAIQWCLAEELMAEYGYPPSEIISKKAAESLALIQAVNSEPPPQAKYERALLRGGRVGADWITHGGFGRG